MHRLLLTFLFFSLLLLVSCDTSGSRQFKLRCDDAAGLQVGAPIVVSGLKIGEIKGFDIETGGSVLVTMQIESSYVDLITDLSVFSIASPDQAFNVTHVRMKPGHGGTPAAPGTVFEADRGFWRRLTKWPQDVHRQISDRRTRELIDNLRRRTEDAIQRGDEEWQKHKPALQEQAREILNRLKDEGEETAKEIREQLRAFVEDGSGAEGDDPRSQSDEQ